MVHLQSPERHQCLEVAVHYNKVHNPSEEEDMEAVHYHTYCSVAALLEDNFALLHLKPQFESQAAAVEEDTESHMEEEQEYTY